MTRRASARRGLRTNDQGHQYERGPLCLILPADVLRAHVMNRCGHCHPVDCFVCARAALLHQEA